MKRICWMLALVSMLCIGISWPDSVSAAVVSDSASDNTTAGANKMVMGDTLRGSITENDDLDYYRFELSSAGCVTLNMTSYMKYYCIVILDSEGKEVWCTDENEWTESVGYRRDTCNVYLEKGEYYMQINGYWYGTNRKSTGTYECVTSFLSSGVNNVESDNSFDTANEIVLGNTITGQISENDDYDTFRFELAEVGCVPLRITSYMQYYCIGIFDSDGKEIWYTDRNEWTESVGYRSDAYNLYLEKGTYYMQINGYRYSDFNKSTGKYVVNTGFVSSGVTFDGDDNSFATAKSIAWKKDYTGQISINDDFDTYMFTLSSGGNLPINITSYMKYYCIRVFDSNGKEIWDTTRNEWNPNVNYRKDIHTVALSAGTYYMQINGYRYSDYDKSPGKYVFSIGAEAAANPGTTKDPAGTKKPGTTEKPKTTNNSSSEKPAVVKKPGTVKSVSAAKQRRALKVKWKKVSGAAGYQICYSTSAKFKGKKTVTTARTTYTLKKLKAKKQYYVKVRAYKVKDGKKLYGKYSKVIKKKTK
ncbi:hypothetical protein D3Z38_09785 [Clostridiales bacterium]|nr:hypothetical protein [Clostridiales bacterium]